VVKKFPKYLLGGGEAGAIIRSIDWSKNPLGPIDRWPENLQITLSIILNSKFPMFLFWGSELVSFYNDAYRPSLGANGKHPKAMGQKGAEVWPEIWGVIKHHIDQVMIHGEATWKEDLLLPIYRNDLLENVYWTFSYSPVFNAQGIVDGVFVTCTETTEKINSLTKLMETEKRVRSLFQQAPVAIAIMRGKDFIVELANKPMLQIWGKGEDVIEQPIIKVLPEIEGQGYIEMLNVVLQTGKVIEANDSLVHLVRNGKEEQAYVNFVYQPYYEDDRSITGVLASAIEVTEQVLSRRKIENAEERARLVIDAAELGMFEVNLVNNSITTSPTFNTIYGFSKEVTREQYTALLHPEDSIIRNDALNDSIVTGKLNYEARIIWGDGSLHWIKVNGKTYFDESGKPARLLGVVQDITEQKLFTEELTKQVKKRTVELEDANLSLTRMNEELERSNSNLEEFAHAASHDLKEPIRKVHFFTNMLKKRLSEKLDEDDARLLSRVEHATRRMNSLIDDLLQYSHVNFQTLELEDINLNDKVTRVLEELELDIQEKQAIIKVDSLPVIKGYRRQLQQLFQNLIGNALKYAKPGVPPEITITLEQVIAEDKEPFQFKPSNVGKAFHKISVSDNGIGFEQQYAGRIFKMFQRLHGKNEYEGTGVGLSIAKKVVENHGGYIMAESAPQQGSTFTIFFPVD
jgi:PAS domain S-box-containing protein